MDRELFPHLVDVSRNLADILGCPAKDLLPMPNATTGMNTVLRSWQRRFCPRAGQRIVCLSVAYGSTKKLLKEISAECGLIVDEVPVEFPVSDEDAVLDALAQTLSKDTALVVLDHVPSNAPIVLPLDRAVDTCRDVVPDALVVVDAAHSLAGSTLELRPAVADALVTNCHKWFCGPKGTAVLYVDPQHQEWVKPLVISHGFGSDFVSGFYWSGLTDFSSWLALDAALAFWESVGFSQARLYAHSLVRDAAEELAEAWGTRLGADPDLFGPMSLVELPLLPAFGMQEPLQYEHAEMWQNALFHRKIEVPVKALSGRLYVRISAHIYNEMEDYAVLRDVVLRLAAGEPL
mmetsp:Transcript_40342/g.111120  ORF Transcript_40342/g.111120 Transcript_40342/m.111120 type:complete len:348 (+) Transcript_40342:469-1512(+)